jgi:hypothetical protein
MKNANRLKILFNRLKYNYLIQRIKNENSNQ